MAYVYVVNKANYNLEKAEQYGDIRYISEVPVNVFCPDRTLQQISPILDDFTNDDHLLLSGNVLGNIMCTSYLIAKNFQEIKLLVYDARNNTYLQHVMRITDNHLSF